MELAKLQCSRFGVGATRSHGSVSKLNGGLADGYGYEVVCGWQHDRSRVFAPVLELRSISISKVAAGLTIEEEVLGLYVRICVHRFWARDRKSVV